MPQGPETAHRPPRLLRPFGGLAVKKLPELSAPTRQYMAWTYLNMLDWADGSGPPPFETGDMGDPFDRELLSPELLATPGGAGAALAACLVTDVCATVLIGGPASERGRLSGAEVSRRKQLGELMVTGAKYETFIKQFGQRRLREPGIPYYPKAVAGTVAFGVKDALGLKDRSAQTNFLASFLFV